MPMVAWSLVLIFLYDSIRNASPHIPDGDLLFSSFTVLFFFCIFSCPSPADLSYYFYEQISENATPNSDSDNDDEGCS